MKWSNWKFQCYFSSYFLTRYVNVCYMYSLGAEGITARASSKIVSFHFCLKMPCSCCHVASWLLHLLHSLFAYCALVRLSYNVFGPEWRCRLEMLTCVTFYAELGMLLDLGTLPVIWIIFITFFLHAHNIMLQSRIMWITSWYLTVSH